MKKVLCLVLLVFSITGRNVFGQDLCTPVGWATENGGVSGGGDANPVVVDNYNDLKNAVTSSSVPVVHIQGTITFPSSGRITIQDLSNKTIFGLPGSKLISTDLTSKGSGIFYIKRVNNLIIRNVYFEGPGAYDTDGNDNLTLDNCTNVWVDHCEFHDGMDGNFDIKNQADYISVTWCMFDYTKAPIPDGPGGTDDHRYSNLIGSSDGATADEGKLRVTFQYCWWGEGCKERMPRVRYGKVHVVNNLFTSSVASNCIRAGYKADMRAEGNYFDGQDKPIDLFEGDYTAVHASNNVGASNIASGTAFMPPYSIAIADPNNISLPIMSCAGATLPDPAGCTVCADLELDSTPSPVAYSLSISTSPSQGGTVSANPEKSSYDEGDTVTLTATAASGYVFTNWSGDLGDSISTVSIIMNEDKSVTANFSVGSTQNDSTTHDGSTVRIEDTDSPSNGVCSYGGSLKAYTGADNGSAINLSNSSGQAIAWKVDVASTGTYELKWRYVNGGSQSATSARLLINGTEVNNSISFPKTVDKYTFTSTAVNADLVSGINEIILETTQDSEFADIDWVEVTGDNPVSADCSSTVLDISRSGSWGIDRNGNLGDKQDFEVYQNYPNPFDQSTVFSFKLAEKGQVSVDLYNTSGRHITKVARGTFNAGYNEVVFDRGELTAGVYIYIFKSDRGVFQQQLIVE